MSLWPRGYGPGIQVVKAAANLPQSGTSNLFTVSGTVLVQFLAGLVTTAIQNQACTLALGTSATGGSGVTTAVATAASIANLAVGNFLVPAWVDAVGGAPVIATAVSVGDATTAFLLPAGTVTWTTSAGNTGQMAWYLEYLPVDAGATVS